MTAQEPQLTPAQLTPAQLTSAHLTSARVAILAPLGGLAIIAFGVLVNAQIAVLLFAAFAILGAIARLKAPARRSFAVRSRAVDVAVLGLLGLALLLLGLTTPLG